MEEIDKFWMQRCIELATKGKTSPNPMVGAVIVKNNRSIGEGFHLKAGMPHAEVMALHNCSDPAGATLYVNLEPCNHYGRTPPCTEAIIKAGIDRVVVGMIDPDPRVSGQGIERLRAAGIAVTVGVLESECQMLNEAFVHRVKHNIAFGILKYAMTLDGKIATSTGDSFWVTGEESRQEVHSLRAKCDAIVVGGNTVRKDNPFLTTHGRGQNPLRVVLSRTLNLPLDCHLWQIEDAPTIVFTTRKSDTKCKDHLTKQGVEIIELESVTPRSVMVELTRRGCNQILWECGGNLGAQAIADQVINKIYAFIAPKIIGGDGINPIGNLGIDRMANAKLLTNVHIKTIGDDILVTGYLKD
jgi:diaminohydroxyphosphoribosylaminopyrimidine deaminase/5-amino-6-(5-phosphoribosylamino)uracil reductase